MGLFSFVATGAGLALTGLYSLGAALGLSSIGPVAGGWFAANMGAGVCAGSGMAAAQSVAMGGAGVLSGPVALIGAAVGVIAWILI